MVEMHPLGGHANVHKRQAAVKQSLPEASFSAKLNLSILEVLSGIGEAEPSLNIFSAQPEHL
jgi:hypothetical protein